MGLYGLGCSSDPVGPPTIITPNSHIHHSITHVKLNHHYYQSINGLSDLLSFLTNNLLLSSSPFFTTFPLKLHNRRSVVADVVGGIVGERKVFGGGQVGCSSRSVVKFQNAAFISFLKKAEERLKKAEERLKKAMMILLHRWR